MSPEATAAPAADAPSSGRIASFADFWPYYMGEHKDPRCRVVHFVGTSGFVVITLACLVDRPLRFGLALLLMVMLGAASFRLEGRRSAAPVLLTMIVVAAFGHPGVLGGVVFAYAWAWVGHFLIEKNRPATFTYPLWSLAGDFAMVGKMWTGKGWRGDGSSLVSA